MQTTDSRRLLPAFLAALSILLLATVSTAVETNAQASEVYVSDVVYPVTLDVDLRDLPRAHTWQPGDPIEVVPEGTVFDFGVEADLSWEDPVRQTASEGLAFSGRLLTNFQGIPFGGGTPPDVVGDVGFNHYIGAVNASRFAIWDKIGQVLVGPTTLNTLWTANGGTAGSPCLDGDGDPIVQYDELANRWLLSEFDTTGNTFCIYISRTADPVAGGWFVYAFSAPRFPDYPQYGVWPDAYYVSSFEAPDLGIYAFDRAKMLVGAPATFQRFTIPALSGTSPRETRILPADHDGAVAPVFGQPNVFARTVDNTQDNSNPNDRIELWEYHVDWTTPANSTFTNVQTLTPAPFTLLPCSPGIRDCVPQPGTTNLIDALFNRAMRRLAWRKFDDGERMVVTQTVDAGGSIAGKRWWELRNSGALTEGAGWSIFQEGTYAPNSVERFMGSVAMNANGDIALGYTASDATSVLPAIRVTARRSGDPAGQMTMDELTIRGGVGVQTTSQRWGDYSSMNVDPANGKTFWYTNEIIQANGLWLTWIGAFRIDPLFIDGFESGDTTAWTASVP
ncbi:MAG: hypothetical protein HC897_13925 [Thermoanaerobaculia bacterium]|nr:hypothetical protein [Thermoanaerobaculia bacterium]